MKETCELCKKEVDGITTTLLYEKGSYPLAFSKCDNSKRKTVCADCLPENVKRVSPFSYELI